MITSATALPLGAAVFEEAYAHVAPHIHRTPMLGSATLSALSGFNIQFKAEMFQRTGSYKIRGPLHKFRKLTAEERARGVVCSSAGNHAQGVALAAQIHGIHAVVVMAANATPSKVAATRGYGAEVVLHHVLDDADDGVPGVEVLTPDPAPDRILARPQDGRGGAADDDVPDLGRRVRTEHQYIFHSSRWQELVPVRVALLTGRPIIWPSAD